MKILKTKHLLNTLKTYTMKNIISHLILAFISTCTLISCNSADAEKANNTPPNCYVILLDLSDRLLYAQQAEKDQEIIKIVFDCFAASVARNLTIKSEDRFLIRIMPQQGSPLRADRWENKLSLDMASFKPSEKATAYNEFKNSLQKNLTELYNEANLGGDHKNYYGTDIWRYFKDQIDSDLSNKYSIRIIVLTDGQFDFESKAHGLEDKRRFTNSHFIKNLKGLDWQEKADKEGWGYIPVELSEIQAKWIICGIRAKNENDLLENQKLRYFWQKWLIESGVHQDSVFTDFDASSDKLKALIRNQVK